MIEQKIKQFFDPYVDIPLEAWKGFVSYLKPFNFRKNEILKEPNKDETYLHFVISGSAGLFLYKEGHDICIDLCYEGHFAGDYFSILSQQALGSTGKSNSEIKTLISQRSPISVMALEPLETLAISTHDLFLLYSQSEIGSRIARMVSEVLYMNKQQQQIDLLTCTAEQRYMKLLELEPLVIRRTASKHIASYLGITPESLSRIRKKLIR